MISGVQVCLCKSKIYFALEDYPRALRFAQQTESSASAKNMKFEAQESQKVIEAIKALGHEMSPTPEQHHLKTALQRQL
jgi:hypothetical protein